MREEFVLDSEEVSERITYYRFNQIYKEIPVYNQNIIIGVSNGKAISFSGYYLPNIKVETTPQKTKIDIENSIKEELGEDINIISNTLSIFGDYEKQSLVYVLLASTNEEAKEFIVDANTGLVLATTDLFSYASVYPYTGEGLDGTSYTINLEEFYDINTFKTRYRFFDSKRNISIADYRSSGLLLSLIASAIPGSTPLYVDMKENQIEINNKNEEFIKSAISAMAHYEKIYDYYLNVLGRDSFDNKGSKIIINLGVTTKSFTNKDLNNAAWFSPTNQMYIGNYEGKSFTASLDVLAHEFTHGVVSYTSKFATILKEKDKPFETGALNEAYADIMGALIEGENWTMGENNVTARNLEDPLSLKHPNTKEGEYYYPDGDLKNGLTLEEYLSVKGYENVTDYDNGGVHRNSTVPSHAAYLMYADGAFTSREEMAKVWYNFLFLLSSYSKFSDCALAVIKNAKNLGLSDGAIYKIIRAFQQTNMLEKDNYTLKGKILNGVKEVGNATIEIYASSGELLEKTSSQLNGSYTFSLPPGVYKIKVTKEDFKEFSQTVVINSDKDLDISISYLKGQKDIQNSCTGSICYKVTLYYLDSSDNTNLEESTVTEYVDKGTVLGDKYIKDALQDTFGVDVKKENGSYIMNIGEFPLEFAWYYRGTNNVFDFNTPIEEDIEIEMKIFNGIFGNDTIIDGSNGISNEDTFSNAYEYFSKWFN